MKNMLPPKASHVVASSIAKINRFKIIIFVLLVVSVYGYIVLTISNLSNAQPSPDQLNQQNISIKSAKVDKKVILQLQQLQDNSINVKTLFDDARDNPFQETAKP